METGAFNDVIQEIIKERDQLKTKNEQLRKALSGICSRCQRLESVIKALQKKPKQ